ncbi:unnamed protein product [Caenorhabditis angaria]|uniref:NOL1/NOP2/Sun domain family member 4 n=1 Tax=Caenorhabditis angaria TaxID=860376 RepID=A0A9P1I3D6_9PELO|nr:unnamed protein product [Caenorhabditis angaria]
MTDSQMDFEEPEKDQELVIQHDWHLGLKEPISSFFIGVKKAGDTMTTFFDVQVTKLIDEFGFTVLPNKTGSEEIKNFGKISLDLVNNLHVNYKNIVTIFVSPVAELRLHGLQTSAHTFDVSSSGQTIISADTSGSLVVSSAMDGKTLRILEGHIMDVYRTQYFPSDLVVLTGGMDLTIRIWAIDSGKCARIFGVGKEILSCSNDGCVFKWSCGTGEILEKWAFEAGKCVDLKIFEETSRFAVICERNLLVVIIENGQRYDIALEEGEPTCLEFSGNSNIIFVGFENGSIAAYDIENRNLISKIKSNQGRVTCLKFYCNRLLAAYNDGIILAYRIPTVTPEAGDSSDIHSEFQLTGPDCDPIYDMKIRGRNLYTSCRDKIMNRSIFYTQIRWKTVKFKPKIARTKPLKTPSALALDHFDFYYGPLFGKKWPSIRLGLLSPNKYLAVINTMCRNWEAHDEILNEMGAIDLLAKVRGSKADDRFLEEKRQRVEVRAKEDLEKANQILADSNRSIEPEEADEKIDKLYRSAAGLGEFKASPGELSTSDLQMGKSTKHTKDFEITGFEGEGVRLPRRQHFIYYPNLRVRSFDRSTLLDFPAPMKDDIGVPSYWLLDGGSLLPVLALGIQKDESVLDMCAAPGGKSLLCALTQLPSRIVCNDFKLARLGQLKRALMTYVPEENDMINRFVLKRKDAGDLKSWDELEAYDKVLADVPCSTDRLSVAMDDGNIFSTAATQFRLELPVLQTRILVNALRSVKIGGSVVYSTCTLSPSQNEAVVENAVAIVKKEYGMQIVEESLQQIVEHMTATGLYRFHNTPIGALITPFLPSNFGPMYICKLTRLQ